MNSINPDSQLPELTTISDVTQTLTSITDVVPSELSERIMEEVTAAGIKMASEVISSEFGKLHDTIQRASSTDITNHEVPTSPIVTPPTPQPSLETAPSLDKLQESSEPVPVEEKKVDVVETPKSEVVEVESVQAPSVQESGLVCEPVPVTESVPEPVQELVKEVQSPIVEIPVVESPVIETPVESPPAAVSEPENVQQSPVVDVPVPEVTVSETKIDESPAVETPVQQAETTTAPVTGSDEVGGQDECQVPTEDSSKSVPLSEATESVSEGSKGAENVNLGQEIENRTEIEVAKTTDAVADPVPETVFVKEDSTALMTDAVSSPEQPSVEKVIEISPLQVEPETTPVAENLPSEITSETDVPAENDVQSTETSSDNNNSGGDVKVVEELKSSAIEQINLLTSNDLVSNDTNTTTTTLSNGVATE